MKLTMTALFQLSLAGISGDAFRLYAAAATWMHEAGTDRVPCSTMANLPGAPKSSKALGKLVLELMTASLLESVDGAYLVREVLSPAASRMRRLRANRQGTNGEQRSHVVREQSSNAVTPSGGAPPPRTPSDHQILPGLDSGISESSSALSSGSEGPVSKPARGRRERFVPAGWEPKSSHTALARELGVALESELAKFRNNEFDKPKSDWDRAFTRWLQNAADWGRARRPAAPPTGSLPLLMDRIQRMEAGDEGN